MFRIGEFSKITQVSIRMLRYYDENGLLIPKKIDEATGYRLYSSHQIEQLNRILFLKDLGFGIRKMKELFSEWEPERIRRELESQKRELEELIQSENDKLIRLQASLNDLERQELHLNTQIVIKKIPSYHVMFIRRVLPDYFSESLLWKELAEKLPDAAGLSCFSVYHDLDYREEDLDIEACIIKDEKYVLKRNDILVRQTEVIEKAACFVVYGPYENISIAYREFGIWLDQHPEYRMSGKTRQICHVTPCDTKDAKDYVTELIVPIETLVE